MSTEPTWWSKLPTYEDTHSTMEQEYEDGNIEHVCSQCIAMTHIRVLEDYLYMGSMLN